MEISFEGWVVEAFLIKKRKTGHTSDSFEVEKLNLNEDLKNYFLNNIRSKICNEENSFIVNLEDFHEFMSDDNKDKDYQITKDELSEINEYFNSLLDKLNEGEQNIVRNNFAKTESSVVLKISHSRQNIFYFRKLKKLLFAGKNKFSIFDGSIREMDEDFLTFDDFIDFIYFDGFVFHEENDENEKFKEKIIIFHRRNFETLFKIQEYCQKKAKDFFDKFDFIEVPDILTEKKDAAGNLMNLKNSFINDGVLSRQLTRILSLSEDQITFEKIKQLKEEESTLRYRIEGNKVKVETKEEIRDLIDLIDEKIAIPLWNKEKKLRFAIKGDGM